MTSYRLDVDDVLSVAVLGQLGRIVERKNGSFFEVCVEAAGTGATLGEITRAIRAYDVADAPIQPVALQRAAVAFERIRNATESLAVAQGTRPKVYLANLGPPAQHKARADFSRGFFNLGGFDVIYGKSQPTNEEVALKAMESGAHIIVICSTDETYPAFVPDLVSRIKTADPERLVILAGYPTDQIEAHRKAGVDDFVHVRVDAVEFLSQLLNKIGATL